MNEAYAEELFDQFGEEYFGKHYGEKLIFLYLRSVGHASEDELANFLELIQRSAFITLTMQGCLAGDLELIIAGDKGISARAPDEKTRRELLRQLKSLDIRLALAARSGKAR